MNLQEWIENNFIKFKDNSEISLPRELLKSNLTYEESKKWILLRWEAEDYYNYFPFYEHKTEKEIIIYFININKNSEHYHKITFLSTDYIYHWLKKDIMSWIDFKNFNQNLCEVILKN